MNDELEKDPFPYFVPTSDGGYRCWFDPDDFDGTVFWGEPGENFGHFVECSPNGYIYDPREPSEITDDLERLANL